MRLAEDEDAFLIEPPILNVKAFTLQKTCCQWPGDTHRSTHYTHWGELSGGKIPPPHTHTRTHTSHTHTHTHTPVRQKHTHECTKLAGSWRKTHSKSAHTQTHTLGESWQVVVVQCTQTRMHGQTHTHTHTQSQNKAFQTSVLPQQSDLTSWLNLGASSSLGLQGECLLPSRPQVSQDKWMMLSCGIEI